MFYHRTPAVGQRSWGSQERMTQVRNVFELLGTTLSVFSGFGYCPTRKGTAPGPEALSPLAPQLLQGAL